VRVRDARQVAGGASGRNGGFALGGGSMAYDQARKWLGPDNALKYWRLTEQYLDRLASLAGDALRRIGSLRVAADVEERDELRAEYDALREDDIAAEWRTDVLGGRFPAAIFHPGDAAIQPSWEGAMAVAPWSCAVGTPRRRRRGSRGAGASSVVSGETDRPFSGTLRAPSSARERDHSVTTPLRRPAEDSRPEETGPPEGGLPVEMSSVATRCHLRRG